MRSVVLVQGVLRGMGQESHCEMLALRDTIPHSPRSLYSLCSVIQAAPGLPDGQYTVSFDCYRVSVFRESGLWLANGATLNDAG